MPHRLARPQVFLALALCAVTLVAALPDTVAAYDWPAFGGPNAFTGLNLDETQITPNNVGQLHRLFHASLPDTADGVPAVLTGAQMPGGTARDVVFLTTRSGHLVALDAHSGAQLWDVQHGPGDCKINNGSSVCYTTSSPAIDPDHQSVYTYGLDGKVHKHVVADGTEITDGGWPQIVSLKPYDEKGSSALAVSTARDGNHYLYVAHAGYPGDHGDYQGHITTINLGTGEQKVFNTTCSDQAVHFAPKGQGPDCSAVRGAVWARQGVVYSPDTDRVYFTTGNAVWSPDKHNWGDTVIALNADGTGVNGNPVDTYTPANYDDLDRRDADLGSAAPTILPMPATSAYPHVGVQTGKDGKLRLLNLDDLSAQGGQGHLGGDLTVADVPQGGQVLMAPATWTDGYDGAGDTWVFVTNNGGVSGLRITFDSTGKPGLQSVWQGKTGGTSPMIAGDVLFYATSGGVLALDPKTGKELWRDRDLGGIHWESPVVVNGILYLTDGNGKLTAWGL